MEKQNAISRNKVEIVDIERIRVFIRAMINYFIQMQNNDKKVSGATSILQHQKKTDHLYGSRSVLMIFIF